MMKHYKIAIQKGEKNDFKEENQLKKHIEIIERMMFAMANHTVDGKRIYPTLKAAKEALEKQIPKKPKIDADEWTCCPNCYSSFKILDSFKERNRYCGNCGQALDWSDTDE